MYVEQQMQKKANLEANQSRYVPPEKFWQSPKKKGPNGTSYDSPAVQTLQEKVEALSIDDLYQIIDNDGVDRSGIDDVSKLRRLAIGILQRPVVQDGDTSYIIVTVPPGCFEGSSVAISVPSLGIAHVRVPKGCKPGSKFRFQIPVIQSGLVETTSNTKSDQAQSNYEYSSVVGDEEHVYDENDVDEVYVEADIGEYDDEKVQDVVDIDRDDDYVV